MTRAIHMLKGVALLLLVFGFVGCDALEDLIENEKEVQGIVEAIGENELTVDGIDYLVTADTEFEDGYESLADVSVGDEVEIEYEENDTGRVALEVEPADEDDD